jgi:hypothetical protein
MAKSDRILHFPPGSMISVDDANFVSLVVLDDSERVVEADQFPNARFVMFTSTDPDVGWIGRLHIEAIEWIDQKESIEPVELLDATMGIVVGPLFMKGALMTEVAGELGYDAVFAAMKEYQRRAGKVRDPSVQEDFNVLLQLASIRDKLVRYGVMQISACVDLMHNKKVTESRRKVMRSPQFSAFVRGCHRVRNELFPKFAALADAIEDFLEFDPSLKIGVVTKLTGTMNDICGFLGHWEHSAPGARIRAGNLTPKTQKARVTGVKAGRVNCVVVGRENVDMLETCLIDRCVLFDVEDCAATGIVAKLSDLVRPRISTEFITMVRNGAFQMWEPSRHQEPNDDHRPADLEFGQPGGIPEPAVGGESDNGLVEARYCSESDASTSIPDGMLHRCVPGEAPAVEDSGLPYREHSRKGRI